MDSFAWIACEVVGTIPLIRYPKRSIDFQHWSLKRKLRRKFVVKIHMQRKCSMISLLLESFRVLLGRESFRTGRRSGSRNANHNGHSLPYLLAMV